MEDSWSQQCLNALGVERFDSNRHWVLSKSYGNRCFKLRCLSSDIVACCTAVQSFIAVQNGTVPLLRRQHAWFVLAILEGFIRVHFLSVMLELCTAVASQEAQSEHAQQATMFEEDHPDTTPLVQESQSVLLLQDSIRRHNTLGSQHAGHSSWGAATGHIITAVVGAGVLTLPHAVSWLGWIGGPLCLSVFFAINVWCAYMLADVFEVNGRRHNRYKHAVYYILGSKQSSLLSAAQHLHLVLLTIGYHIAAADSMRFIIMQSCAAAGKQPGECPDQQWLWTVVFGGLQMLMSGMVPNLESAWLSSLIGAAMSLGYSIVAVALGASQAGNGLGSLTGVPAAPAQKLFGVLTALGNVAFAYNSCVVMVEIQDTLREPPTAAVSMRKAITLSMSTCYVLYMLVGCLGYAALGDAVPSSILQGFPAAPSWVRTLGNVLVLVHMAPAYQVYAQPLYATFEDCLLACLPSLGQPSKGQELVCSQQEQQQQDVQVDDLGQKSTLLLDMVTVPPALSYTKKRAGAIRMVYRTLYVCCTTLIAAALPFFGAFGGLIGAVTFYPTAVYFPSVMYCKVHQPSRHSLTWYSIVFVNIVIAAVTLLATVGSLSNIVDQAAAMHAVEAPDRA